MKSQKLRFFYKIDFLALILVQYKLIPIQVYKSEKQQQIIKKKIFSKNQNFTNDEQIIYDCCCYDPAF